jgi:hypothetical protein
MRHHFLLLLVLAVFCGPTALLLVLALALTAAMLLVRAVWHLARFAFARSRKVPVDYCCCGHTCADHVNSTGRCRGEDPEGERCLCRAFDPGIERVDD